MQHITMIKLLQNLMQQFTESYIHGAWADLEGSWGLCGRLDGLAIDDGQQRGVHGLPQGGVEAVVGAPLRRVADGVPRTAPDNLTSQL